MTISTSDKSLLELSSALELLHRLIPKDQIEAFSFRHSPATVYTTLATVWMLTLQRLDAGCSLEAIVKETLNHHREIFPDNKRVREGSLSLNPSAFSEARQRLSLTDTENFTDAVAHSIINSVPDQINNHKVFIIDGTTFKLSPTSDLREAYPPATNQHGETVWPIIMLTVAHEMHSGAALRPEFGAMYGKQNTSEAKQAIAIAERIPKRSIVLADTNYGIYSVVRGMMKYEHEVLFRLSKSRFMSMVRDAKLLHESPTSKSYRLSWKPSVYDRKANPEFSRDEQLEVELHAVEISAGEWLYLVTSVVFSSDEAAKLYSNRYDIEHDIRDIKVTLNIEKIRSQSDEMVRKEVLCGMVAYNLVVQLRREAAKIAKLPPRRLSFTRVWNTLEICLLRQIGGDATTWQDRYAKALKIASRDILPNRPGRSFERRAHPKRPKSTKFMKKKNSETTEPPPVDGSPSRK
jgi:Transposase DDE domain